MRLYAQGSEPLSALAPAAAMSLVGQLSSNQAAALSYFRLHFVCLPLRRGSSLKLKASACNDSALKLFDPIPLPSRPFASRGFIDIRHQFSNAVSIWMCRLCALARWAANVATGAGPLDDNVYATSSSRRDVLSALAAGGVAQALLLTRAPAAQAAADTAAATVTSEVPYESDGFRMTLPAGWTTVEVPGVGKGGH